MNYLAHAHLSFHNPGILAGNMISDFVKGKKKFDFPRGIQTGISLHRHIDDFTDTHEVTLQAKQLFRPVYRLYAAAFMDIVYDHFLANDTHEFAGSHALELFSFNTYDVLARYENIFPANFKLMFPFMQTHNWLYNYRLREGIHRSFGGMVRRAQFMSDPTPAIQIFEDNYDALQQSYNSFFPSLKDFAVRRLQLLKTT